ncbi:MAG: hypothetical protein ACRDPO_34355 [Streptosporangiaceae bacterium]
MAAASQRFHHTGRGRGRRRTLGELSGPQLARFCELTAVAAVLITVAVSLVAIAISQW